MTTTETPATRHPAKWNSKALAAAAELIALEAARLNRPVILLDPFAGVGRIHELANETITTYGVELEEEWASQHERTVLGNALDLPFDPDEFDLVVTSPTFGNRMADHHKATDPCKLCEGLGCHPAAGPDTVIIGCSACGGTGLSKRNTYRHALGRPLTAGSSGAMQWGSEYREFHERAWREAVRVLRPGGIAIIDLKNHVRNGIEQRVTEWHINTWLVLGCTLHEARRIPVRGNRQGANADVRIDAELLLAFRTPDTNSLLGPGN